MTIQYSRARVDKIVDGTDITGVVIGVNAVDDADDTAAYMDGIVEFDPVKTSLTQADVDAAVTAFRAQENEAEETVDTQLANQIAAKQAATVVENVDYDSLPAS